jgi:hypothetical protein
MLANSFPKNFSHCFGSKLRGIFDEYECPLFATLFLSTSYVLHTLFITMIIIRGLGKITIIWQLQTPYSNVSPHLYIY